MNCLSCRATTSNGLALCELCQTFATRCLEFLPIYFRNLARWRPGRAGSRPVPGSRVLYDGDMTSGGDRVERALDETGAAIVGWARCLHDDRGVELPASDDEAGTVAAVCLLLTEHLTSVATLEWAGEFVRDLSKHEEALRALTETVVPGWYAGACRRCSQRTYVVPGLTWVTCGGCGSTTYARDHLDVILTEARDWIATPKQLAQALVAMLDTEQSVESLRKRIAIWGNREHIEVHRPHDYALKRYRFGDVFDRLIAKGPTRGDLLPKEADAC